MKCASFFAGVGGIDLGFVQTGFFTPIYANEFDKNAVKTYEKNSNIKVDNRDIRLVDEKALPDFDCLLAGFPCQPFSITGKQEGFSDMKGRGTLFFELIRIIKYKKPSVIFLENVKNLVTHDNGNTMKVIIKELEALNYHLKFQVLNATEYGNIPQNRERIYIVGFLDENVYNKFDFPRRIPLTVKVSDILDYENKVEDKYYYIKGKNKEGIYETLVNGIDDDKAVYQLRRSYVRKNKSGVIPTLTANQGQGGNNVCIIKTKYGIRKMTPRECFNAQGFPNTFIIPQDVCDSKLYQQAGNTVCVSVIQRIAEMIQDAFTTKKSLFMRQFAVVN